VVGIKCERNSKYGYISCIYDFKVCGQYKLNIHSLRELSDVQNIVVSKKFEG